MVFKPSSLVVLHKRIFHDIAQIHFFFQTIFFFHCRVKGIILVILCTYHYYFLLFLPQNLLWVYFLELPYFSQNHIELVHISITLIHFYTKHRICPSKRIVMCTCNMFIKAPDKSGYSDHNFLISPQKHIVGTHQKCLSETLLMSTHNICFSGEIRKV